MAPREPKTTTFIELITEFDDGTFLVSLSSKPELGASPSCFVIRRIGATPAELFQSHIEGLSKDLGKKKSRPAFEGAQAAGVFERFQHAMIQYQVGRKVFISAENENRFEGARNPEVLAEIAKLEQRSTSWRAAILILLFSLLIFLGVGLPGNMSFLRLLALVPILLFHEAGHYVAMRWFGYRNLKMFFIPGFGAAVSGRHYNVAGWKKVVVSLMGPVPGIVVGIAIGVCGIYWRSQLAMEASLLMLALNAFNLIPILPLDGGHVVRTIIFARHYWLDIGFRAIAALIVGGLGAFAKSPILIAIGVGMLLGLPQALRVARLSRELQKEGLNPVSKDSNTIPPEVADRIVDRLKERDPKPAHARTLAMRTVSIFETLNTNPPGWLASFGLLTVHALSLAAAVLFAFLVVIAQRGPILDVLREAAEAPRSQVSSSDVIKSKALTPPAVDNVTIAATFKDHQAAQAAYRALEGDEHSMMLFGDSVLVTVPGSDASLQKKLLGKFRDLGAELCLSDQLRLRWNFIAVGPSSAEAEAVAQTLNDYFGLYSVEPLRAPWSAQATTPEEKRARRTSSRILSADVDDDPELLKIGEELGAYEDKEETQESKALQERYDKRRRSLELEHVRAIAADPSPEIDQSLVKKYLEIAEANPDQDVPVLFATAVAPQLGVADPVTDPTSASAGFAMVTGANLSIPMMSFDQPAEGARAFVLWLESKGFRQIRYRVRDWGGAEELLNARTLLPGDEKKPS